MFVPQSTHNLASVSSLIRFHNCSITFYPIYYAFQDLNIGQATGSGCQDNGLYYDGQVIKSNSALQSSANAEDDVRWNRHLGHVICAYTTAEESLSFCQW